MDPQAIPKIEPTRCLSQVVLGTPYRACYADNSATVNRHCLLNSVGFHRALSMAQRKCGIVCVSQPSKRDVSMAVDTLFCSAARNGNGSFFIVVRQDIHSLYVPQYILVKSALMIHCFSCVASLPFHAGRYRMCAELMSSTSSGRSKVVAVR